MKALALMEAASFCGAQRNKRYSGQQENASKKSIKKPPNRGEWRFFINL